jgi:hypothetical protein
MPIVQAFRTSLSKAARGGSRTPTPIKAQDPKSSASANFATLACCRSTKQVGFQAPFSTVGRIVSVDPFEFNPWTMRLERFRKDRHRSIGEFSFWLTGSCGRPTKHVAKWPHAGSDGTGPAFLL